MTQWRVPKFLPCLALSALLAVVGCSERPPDADRQQDATDEEVRAACLRFLANGEDLVPATIEIIDPELRDSRGPRPQLTGVLTGLRPSGDRVGPTPFICRLRLTDGQYQPVEAGLGILDDRD